LSRARNERQLRLQSSNKETHGIYKSRKNRGKKDITLYVKHLDGSRIRFPSLS
jgi:hypothetical protein